MHPVSDLGQGQGRIIQKKEYLVDGIVLNPVQGTLPGNLLADSREVFGSHAEFACIPGNLALLPAILLGQGKEPHEELG